VLEEARARPLLLQKSLVNPVRYGSDEFTCALSSSKETPPPSCEAKNAHASTEPPMLAQWALVQPKSFAARGSHCASTTRKRRHVTWPCHAAQHTAVVPSAVAAFTSTCAGEKRKREGGKEARNTRGSRVLWGKGTERCKRLATYPAVVHEPAQDGDVAIARGPVERRAPTEATPGLGRVGRAAWVAPTALNQIPRSGGAQQKGARGYVKGTRSTRVATTAKRVD